MLTCTALILAVLAPTSGGEEISRPVVPPTLVTGATAPARIAAALENAARYNRRVLIQWGADDSEQCGHLLRLFTANRRLREALALEYDLVLVDAAAAGRDGDLLRRFGVDLGANALPHLTVLDGKGRPVAQQDAAGLVAADAQGKQVVDPGRVRAFLAANRVEHRRAREYMKAALARSHAEHKPLFLHFGADWCGNCRQLEAWMVDPDVAPLLDREFVALKIDTDETRGGRKLLDRTRTGEPGGIPWFAFFGTDGKLLMDSNRPDGKNVGYPKSGVNAVHFRNMLKTAGKGLSAAELGTLIGALSRY